MSENDPFGNRTLSISRGAKDGLVEVHAGFTGVIVVRTGSATLVIGGTISEPHVEGAGEIRG